MTLSLHVPKRSSRRQAKRVRMGRRARPSQLSPKVCTPPSVPVHKPRKLHLVAHSACVHTCIDQAPRALAEEAKRIMREQLDMALLEVKRLLSAATCWLAIALRALGLQPVPEPAFGTAQNRYLQRFEGFQTYEDGLFVPCAELQEQLRPAPGALGPGST